MSEMNTYKPNDIRGSLLIDFKRQTLRLIGQAVPWWVYAELITVLELRSLICDFKISDESAHSVISYTVPSWYIESDKTVTVSDSFLILKTRSIEDNSGLLITIRKSL